MSTSIFHVRPLDGGNGWAIDEYDGRGAWQHSVLKTPEGAVMDKQAAQRAVFQLRRKTVNSAPKAELVNKVPCGDRCLDNPAWVCARASGHPGRHESSDGGDWHDDGSVAQRTTSKVECEEVRSSVNPSELVRVALQHWEGIGWPEDAGPIECLQRALAILNYGDGLKTLESDS